MTKSEKIQSIKNAVENALSKYDASNVDIVKEEEMIYIVYHSRHNSFPIISNVCASDSLTESDIAQIADCYAIGYCW